MENTDILLSIVIPTYNMEDYLCRCIESLIVNDKDILQKIEVLVVIDGATDHSSEIAHCYQDKYPSIVKVIDKENGNYGSCVNRGLQEAKGKYIKIVDADDWVETDEFSKLVGKLSSLDVDLVITDFHRMNHNGNIIYTSNYSPTKSGIIDAKELVCQPCMQMHALTYRTQMLREHHYVQTTGISYTDTEWAVIPMLYVRQFAYLPCKVYCYQVGRGGQTMDSSVIIKRCSNFVKTFTKIIEWLKNENIGNIENTYSYKKLHESVVFFYYTILLESCMKQCDELRQFDLWLKSEFLTLYEHLDCAIDNQFSKFQYVRYWRNNDYIIRKKPMYYVIKGKLLRRLNLN